MYFTFNFSINNGQYEEANSSKEHAALSKKLKYYKN